MASTQVDQIDLEIAVSAEASLSQLDNLIARLNKLGNTVASATKLDKLKSSIDGIVQSANRLSPESNANLERLQSTLEKFNGMKISSTIPTNLSGLAVSVEKIQSLNFDSLDGLADSMNHLAPVRLSLTSSINQLNKLSSAVTAINNTDTNGFNAKMNDITSALGLTGMLGRSNLSTYITNLSRLPAALSGLQNVNIGQAASNIRTLVNALAPLSSNSMARTNLSGYMNSLAKLPTVMADLHKLNMTQIATDIQNLANALAPLGTQMERISRGFALFPARINQFVSGATGMNTALNRGARGFRAFNAQTLISVAVVYRLARALANAMKSSNDYIENINLFTASMGEYVNQAYDYAQTVSNVLGIDPSEWMRNQGVFMTITKGFGVMADRAYIMSKNLTQLGYDFASFFNIPVADAMQKLQAGISGELEPLRRLGVDLSEVRIKAEAAALGITKSFNDMNQAEKAQIRYIAIMKQVTQAHGDMARTLNTPANQLRVLRAQFEMLARSIGNIFIPVLNMVLPYVVAIVKLLREGAEYLASLVGFELPTVDYSGLDTGTGAVADNLDAAEESAKKLKKHLVGIDELNIISPDTDSEPIDYASQFNFDLPQYDFLSEAIKSKADDIKNQIARWLEEMKLLLMGAAFVLGAILVATGIAIPLGLAMMAYGAYKIWQVAKENWDAMPDALAAQLRELLFMLGGFVFGLGAALLFTGINIPLGLTMMAIGAAMMYQAGVIHFTFLKEDLEGLLHDLVKCVGAFLIGLGALLTFFGVNIPLGITLMAMGLALEYVEFSSNWGYPPEVEQALIGLENIIGGFLLGLGLILTFSGINIGIGILLIASGLAVMYASAVLDWEKIKNDIGACMANLELAIAGFFLGLGAVLTFTGANVPLGITLMAMGAAKIATTMIKILWGKEVEDNIMAVINIIEYAVSAASLALGAILLFSGANIPIGLALLVGGAITLAAEIRANWDSITNSISDCINLIDGIVAGAFLAIGALLTFTGANIPLGIALIAMGAANIATAMIKILWGKDVEDNIMGVINTIEYALSAAPLVLGAILLFSGANIPIGLALLVGGAVSLAGKIWANWDNIVNTISGCINLIDGIVAGAFLAIGAVLIFSGAGIGIGLALLAAGALVLAVSLNPLWDSMPDQVKYCIYAVEAILVVSFLAIGALLTFTGVNIPLGIALLAAGAAVMGTAMAANWDAMVTQITETLAAIYKPLSVAFLVIGALLLFTGVYIPLGIALLAAGAAGIITWVATIDWNSMFKKINEKVGEICDWLKKAGKLALGVILCLTGVGIPKGVALIDEALDHKPATVDWKAFSNKVGETCRNVINSSEELKNHLDKDQEFNTKTWQVMTRNAGIYLGSGSEGLGGKVNEAAKNVPIGLRKGIEDTSSEATKAVSNLADKVSGGFATALQIKSPSRVFMSHGNYIVEGVRDGINNNESKALSAVKTLGSKIATSFNQSINFESFAKTAKLAIDWFNSGINNAIPVSSDTVKNWGKWITYSFKSEVDYTSFWNIAVNIINGFNDSIRNGISYSTNAVASWASSIINTMKSWLNIHSPSKVFAEIGLFVTDGFNEGIESGSGATAKVIKDWANMIVEEFNPDVDLEINKSALNRAKNALAGSVDTDVSGSVNVAAEGFEAGMEQLWETKMKPLVQSMAGDMRRQADKEEKTVVTLDAKKVNRELDKQKKVNGYQFIK